MSEELKPCPFCGRVPICSRNNNRYDYDGRHKRGGKLYQPHYGYICTPCGVERFVDVEDPFSDEARIKAKEHWNTRANEYNHETHILLAKADVPEEKTIRKINKYVLSDYPQQMDEAPPTLVEKSRVRRLLELIADKMER